MSERVYNLFCIRHGDPEGEQDEIRRGIPGWRLPSAVAWAVFRGFDAFHIDAVDGEPACDRLTTHHACRDSRCPGGCD